MKKIKILFCLFFILCLLLITFSACNKEPASLNHYGADPSLTNEEIEALNTLLVAKNKAVAVHQKTLDSIGENDLLEKVIEIERKQLEGLIELFVKYDIELTQNDYYSSADTYNSLSSACNVFFETETENSEIYDRFISIANKEDISDIFKSFKDDSVIIISLFEQCYEQ